MTTTDVILEKIEKEIPKGEKILRVEHEIDYPSIDLFFGIMGVPCVVIYTNKGSHCFKCSKFLEEFFCIDFFAYRRAKEIIAQLNSKKGGDAQKL